MQLAALAAQVQELQKDKETLKMNLDTAEAEVYQSKALMSLRFLCLPDWLAIIGDKQINCFLFAALEGCHAEWRQQGSWWRDQKAAGFAREGATAPVWKKEICQYSHQGKLISCVTG